MKELKFHLITKSSENGIKCIYFHFKSDLANSPGIIYCPDEEPKGLFVTKLTKIDDSWYYFEMD